MSQPQSSGAKQWCFTLHYDGNNGYNREDALERLENLASKCNYLVAGDEVCPTTGQKHFQGFCQLKKQTRRTELVRIINCFFEITRGTPEEADSYCRKTRPQDLTPNDVVEEWGEMKETNPGTLEKNRWKRVRQMLAEGNIENIDDQIYVQHYASLRAIMKDNMKPVADREALCDEWIVGPSGCGKSSYVRKNFTKIYPKNLNKWWDGYKQEHHDVAVIDDMDPKHSMLSTFLKVWTDHYAFIGENKGGACMIRPKKIVVTSQYTIAECFPGEPETIEALTRRFKVIRMGGPLQLGAPTPPLSGRILTFNAPDTSASTVIVDLSGDDQEIGSVLRERRSTASQFME